MGRKCPFYEGECEFPDGKHFEDENFVGCKVVDYERGNEVVYWVCPRFPVNMSITAVREAFMRTEGWVRGKEHERKRVRR